MRVDETKDHQPGHPLIEQCSGGPSVSFLVDGKEDDPCSKDCGEQGPHLAFKKDNLNSAHSEVDILWITPKCFRKIIGHGEAGHVHEQDPQQGNAT